ncbi:HIT family protein [Tropheryma whipplei]|uniref:HIT domain-containing protein n=1 Tax=Tropheryma whipplei (strain Twist) TaxID=203267 RepID=Q83GK4_TROWT|nr:HIT domain-containing protein [Tropheryma whipplei]AAO44360.1 unknown [Tropheryma whipplei str. Twist]MCO8182625.1 HIT domain-containing protein [Tropheryma whipplei]MCO8190242.1 HIT domain-containing protein [Tropheryma whipplei]CAD67174.1 conserved hypothetical protein [Tropheryma whipplei TW08/27]
MQEGSSDFAGIPDGYKRLWTPHRVVYLEGARHDGNPETCPFCSAYRKTDEEGLIVYRGDLSYVVMNLYPYNSGHTLVCPYRHIATYDLASSDEILEMGLLLQKAILVSKRVLGCEGFNIGINQGRVAGAGIAGHLHQHIVPRWAFDSNFFPIIARTKALPKLIEQVRCDLQRGWDDLV